jgi:molecular chaperone GrpE
LDEQRSKLPEPQPVPEEPDPDEPAEASRLPEEAREIYELVEDEEDSVAAVAVSAPAPIAVPAVPDYPEEALEELRALKAKLDHKDRQIEQVMEAYRSKKAETEKLRKRIEKTERRRFEQSKGDFIARFVEVLDNLDRAIDSIENAFDPDSVLQGIMLVRSRLVQLLKEEGLEKIFVRGQIFDPSNSEAAGMEPVEEESQDGIVLRELQPGYMLKGSLLRVARVVVGRRGAAGPSEPESRAVDPSESTTADGTPTISTAVDAASPKLQDDDGSWEASDASGPELQFSDDGLDFSSD